MIAAAHNNPEDEAILGALADLLAEMGDPRERWLRRHICLRAKLKSTISNPKSQSKNSARRLKRRSRRLTYALHVNV
jgi:hypothetical protein